MHIPQKMTKKEQMEALKAEIYAEDTLDSYYREQARLIMSIPIEVVKFRHDKE